MNHIEVKALTGHACISFECVEDNHTLDFYVETNVSFQMLTE